MTYNLLKKEITKNAKIPKKLHLKKSVQNDGFLLL